MKDSYPSIALVRICRLLGFTRQAYYQHFNAEQELGIEHELILSETLRIRQNHRRMGGRKLFEKLDHFMLEHQIKMGRDAYFDFLSVNGLLVRRRIRKVSTTWSGHWLRKFPNLIRQFKPTAPNQLIVSDITYLRTDKGFVYVSLVTDAYSKKILGYHVSPTLETKGPLMALKMAIRIMGKAYPGLIHHSDRGVQYCSGEYVKLLKDNHINISMTESGDPLENAVAERINGILKHEYLCFDEYKNLEEVVEGLRKAVDLYNMDRPHLSLGMLTPENVHQNNLPVEKLWKTYYYKNRNLVNPNQDLIQPVNIVQDY